MTSEEFKAWREGLGLSQRKAAAELGISQLSVLNYDRGFKHSDKSPVEIPTKIALACEAIRSKFNRENAKLSWRPIAMEQLLWIENYLEGKGIKYRPLQRLTLNLDFYSGRIDELFRWIHTFVEGGYSAHKVPGQAKDEKGFMAFQFDTLSDGTYFGLMWGGSPPPLEKGD